MQPWEGWAQFFLECVREAERILARGHLADEERLGIARADLVDRHLVVRARVRDVDRSAVRGQRDVVGHGVR